MAGVHAVSVDPSVDGHHALFVRFVQLARSARGATHAQVRPSRLDARFPGSFSGRAGHKNDSGLAYRGKPTDW